MSDRNAFDGLLAKAEAGSLGLGDILGLALRGEITPAQSQQLSDARCDFIEARATQQEPSQ